MILRSAIVGGALELLPQTLATSAMVPMQTQMVYRAGAQRGFDLDRKSFFEFVATAGPGMAWQVFEGFARRLTGRRHGHVLRHHLRARPTGGALLRQRAQYEHVDAQRQIPAAPRGRQNARPKIHRADHPPEPAASRIQPRNLLKGVI